MSTLKNTASELAKKYITASNNPSASSDKPKRGLQAEINKLESIRRLIGTKDFDARELSRFRASINILANTVDERIKYQ